MRDPRRVGPYRVLGRLGQGGMGTVYRAAELEGGVEVALKVLPAGAVNASATERFRKEAEVLRSLAHPAIVGLTGEPGVDGELHYYAMEMVRGQSLAQVLRTAGTLSPRETIAVGIAVLEALAAAHAEGVIHRDVKPSNVLLSEGGRVKVVDFGLARALDQTRLTRSHERIGTPAFMSPEQADGHDAAEPSDLYSTGCLLYTCLTGDPPFEAESPLAVMLKHLQAEPPSLGASASGAFDAAVLRALSKQPDQRFASALAFADALRALPEADDEAGRAAALAALAGSHPTGAFAAPEHDTGPDDDTIRSPDAGQLTAPPPASDRAPAPTPRRSRAAVWRTAVLATLGLLITVGIWQSARRERAPDRATPPSTVGDDVDAKGVEPLVPSAPTPRAEVLTTSGETIVGTLRTIDALEAVIELEDGTTRSVPRAAIARIRYEDE